MNSFLFIIEKSFSNTFSAIVVILFGFLFITVIVLWIATPFVLLSIKKEITSIKKELQKNNNVLD